MLTLPFQSVKYLTQTQKATGTSYRQLEELEGLDNQHILTA